MRKTIAKKRTIKKRKTLQPKEVSPARILNTLIEHALKGGASHVHIEPTETAILVRLRINGTLRPTIMLAQCVAAGLTTRIKTLAHINADKQSQPQDGDFSIQTPEAHYVFRVATIPVIYGEKIVLQITKRRC